MGNVGGRHRARMVAIRLLPESPIPAHARARAGCCGRRRVRQPTPVHGPCAAGDAGQPAHARAWAACCGRRRVRQPTWCPGPRAAGDAGGPARVGAHGSATWDGGLATQVVPIAARHGTASPRGVHRSAAWDGGWASPRGVHRRTAWDGGSANPRGVHRSAAWDGGWASPRGCARQRRMRRRAVAAHVWAEERRWRVPPPNNPV